MKYIEKEETVRESEKENSFESARANCMNGRDRERKRERQKQYLCFEKMKMLG